MFGPLTVRPAKSRGSKTGAWRMQGRPRFLRQNCIACKMCALVCPEGCISGAEKNTYDSDYVYCKGCSLCVKVCPKQDIVMTEEAGEKK